ncbi:hypothetical protein [Paracoccus pacificus]|uniref:Uncharacterized protein n=1 Tax=Paracoccus pacificus TaxID=1463598 RepID=A0ABW4R2W4_9RHOB
MNLNETVRKLIQNAPEILVIAAAASLIAQLLLGLTSTFMVARQGGGMAFFQTLGILATVIFQPAMILGVAAIAAYLRDGHWGKRG